MTVTNASLRTVGDFLADAVARLRASGSPTPRLDAELLVAHVVDRDRAWVLAHPEAELADAERFVALVERRASARNSPTVRWVAPVTVMTRPRDRPGDAPDRPR